VSPSVEGTENEQLFAAGKLAMSAWGRWPLPTFIGAEFKDFDVQYWPRKTAATSIHGIGGWGISPRSENKALAWELIKDFTSLDTNTALANAGASIPALRSAAETPEFLSYPPNAKIYYESLNDTKPVPSPPNFNEFESIFIRHFGEILSGGTSPEDGLNAAHEELSEAMAKLSS
jgi:multiple sugar transport system substrate-binding protein